MSQLPAAVLEQLPLILTRGGAIERSLLDTMVRNVAAAASVADQQKMVKEAHMRTFTQLKTTYYQYAAARAKLRQEKAGARLFPGVTQHQSPAPAEFGEYDDKDGYRGWIPSTSWIAGALCFACKSVAALCFACKSVAAQCLLASWLSSDRSALCSSRCLCALLLWGVQRRLSFGCRSYFIIKCASLKRCAIIWFGTVFAACLAGP